MYYIQPCIIGVPHILSLLHMGAISQHVHVQAEFLLSINAESLVECMASQWPRANRRCFARRSGVKAPFR